MLYLENTPGASGAGSYQLVTGDDVDAPFAQPPPFVDPGVGGAEREDDVDTEETFNPKRTFKRAKVENDIEKGTTQVLNEEIKELVLRLREQTTEVFKLNESITQLRTQKNELKAQVESLNATVGPLQQMKQELIKDIQKFVSHRRDQVPQILFDYFLRSSLFWNFMLQSKLDYNDSQIPTVSTNFFQSLKESNPDLYEMCEYYKEEFAHVMTIILKNILSIKTYLVADNFSQLNAFLRAPGPAINALAILQGKYEKINIATYAQCVWILLQTLEILPQSQEKASTVVQELQKIFIKQETARK
jgi:hypothetical protein